MANKKPTDKKIKKVSTSDLRSKAMEDLQKLLASERKDLLEAKKSLKANELANPNAVKKMRRHVARLKTIINEKLLDEKKSNNEKREEK